MAGSSQISEIEAIVRDELGDERVRTVTARQFVNDGDAKILLVEVVYDASRTLTVDEMDQIMDRAWLTTGGAGHATPIFDFREDTDTEFVAAE